MKNPDPFRRNIPRRGGRETPINPEFRDISDPKEMLKFIKENSNVLKNQDAEIDNLEGGSELQEPAPGASPPLRQERLVGIRNSTFQASQEQQEPEDDIVDEELEEYQQQEPAQKQSPAAQKPSPNGILSKIKTDGLPPDALARIQALENTGPPKKIISNVGAGEAAQAPPPISAAQMRRKIEAEVQEDIAKGRIPNVNLPKTAMRFSINAPADTTDVDWVRFEPVSGCIFYNQSEIFVRRFNLVDTIRVTTAMENKDISGFIDAIGACVREPFNVRDMTYPDFTYLLYWHWFNSYTKVPHDLEWTSKYGNKNIYKVTETNLKVRTPTISKVDYLEWVYHGFAVPTLRDVEIFMKEDLTPEEEYLLGRAQFFGGNPDDPSIQSKIDNMTILCSKSTEPIQMLGEFRKAIDHEVVESVDVIDAKFDPQVWINVLEGQMQIVTKERDDYEAEDDSLSALGAEDERIAIEKEIQRLTDGLDRINEGEQGVVLADVETIRLDRPILSFFPKI